jgi:hypothetical protein
MNQAPIDYSKLLSICTPDAEPGDIMKQLYALGVRDVSLGDGQLSFVTPCRFTLNVGAESAQSPWLDAALRDTATDSCTSSVSDLSDSDLVGSAASDFAVSPAARAAAIARAMQMWYVALDMARSTPMEQCRGENSGGMCPRLRAGKPCSLRHRNPVPAGRVMATMVSRSRLWKRRDCDVSTCPYRGNGELCLFWHPGDGEMPQPCPALDAVIRAVDHERFGSLE